MNTRDSNTLRSAHVRLGTAIVLLALLLVLVVPSLAQGATWKSCGSIAFEENSDFGAFNIRAKNTSCKTARKVAKRAKSSKAREDKRYKTRGFRCTGQFDSSGSIPSTAWKCSRNSARVKFTT